MSDEVKDFPSPSSILVETYSLFSKLLTGQSKDLGLFILAYILLEISTIQASSRQLHLLGLFFLLGSFFIMILISVRLSRYVLLGSELSCSYSKEIWRRFLIAALKVSGVVIGVALLMVIACLMIGFGHSNFKSIEFYILAGLPIAYLIARISLVYPAAAIESEQGATISDSFTISKVGGVKYPVALFLPIVPFSVLTEIIERLPLNHLLLNTTTAVLNAASLVLIVVCQSICYRYLVDSEKTKSTEVLE